MHTYLHPRPMVTVDVVAFTREEDVLLVLLVERNQEPYQGLWALPGGFVGMDESLENAAARELAEETGLVGIPLNQTSTYGDPRRDPRGRVISVVYTTFIPAGRSLNLQAGSDANRARWFPVDDLPSLAFDHHQIIADAILREQDRINPLDTKRGLR